MINYILLLFFKISISFSQENEYQFTEEIDNIMDQFEDNLKNSTKKNPIKVAITSISFSRNISHEMREYFLSKISSLNKEQTKFQLFICEECINPRIGIDPLTNSIKVEKGITRFEDLKKVEDTFKVKHIAQMNLSYDSQELSLHVNVININSKKTVWSNQYNYFTVKKDNISEMAFYVKWGFYPQVSFTNIIQLGIGENIFGKRNVGLNIDITMPSLNLKNYFSFGPYFTIPLNHNRITYKIHFVLGYGIVNSSANVVFHSDFIVQFFPHMHVFLGLRTSLELRKTKIDPNDATKLYKHIPLTTNIGFGLDF